MGKCYEISSHEAIFGFPGSLMNISEGRKCKYSWEQTKPIRSFTRKISIPIDPRENEPKLGETKIPRI